MKQVMDVRPIKKNETYYWLLKRHYAKRKPSISYAFGLYEDKVLTGVVSYGLTGNNNLNELCGLRTLELNRLCVDSSAKNASSYLVGNSLKMLPAPVFVISYADTGQGHIGYIYQATNWIYTGLGSAGEEYVKNGKRYHSKGFSDKFGSRSRATAKKHGYEVVKTMPKHRYVTVVGDKRIKKHVAKNMPWKKQPYPKGETSRYDASANVQTQMMLF